MCIPKIRRSCLCVCVCILGDTNATKNARTYRIIAVFEYHFKNYWNSLQHVNEDTLNTLPSLLIVIRMCWHHDNTVHYLRFERCHTRLYAVPAILSVYCVSQPRLVKLGTVAYICSLHMLLFRLTPSKHIP